MVPGSRCPPAPAPGPHTGSPHFGLQASPRLALCITKWRQAPPQAVSNAPGSQFLLAPAPPGASPSLAPASHTGLPCSGFHASPISGSRHPHRLSGRLPPPLALESHTRSPHSWLHAPPIASCGLPQALPHWPQCLALGSPLSQLRASTWATPVRGSRCTPSLSPATPTGCQPRLSPQFQVPGAPRPWLQIPPQTPSMAFHS